MPNSAPKPCIQCGTLVRDGTSRCAAHKAKPGSFADKRRGSRHERGYGAAWDRRRERILARDGGLCQPSLRHGLVVQATQVDHIVPKSMGGDDDDDNLQSISKSVHEAKTAAEARGHRWDERAWFEQRARAEGGGVRILAASSLRTGLGAELLRAQVSEKFSRGG